MELIEEVVPLAGRELVIERPRDPDALLDEAAFAARDEFVPYWADLWPSALVLARAIAPRALHGCRVLELGCGLALPSLAVALAGGRAVATDWAPEALAAATRNAERNGLAVETVLADWRDPAAIAARGPFALVVAADVLYEQRNVTPLTETVDGLGRELWLADPGRPPAAEFLENLQNSGWKRSTLVATDRPRVTVHRLVPGRMS